MKTANTVSTPISDYVVTEQTDEDEIFPYREAVGALMYAMTTTRPDIAFVVGYLSRYCENPTLAHWKTVERVIRYLKGSANYDILYRRSRRDNVCVNLYTDADFASDTETRRSTSGVFCLVNQAPVIWKSRRQSTVSLSTTEAELVAGCHGLSEVMWVEQSLRELGCMSDEVIHYVDNQAAIRLIDNEVVSPRRNHFRKANLLVLETESCIH